MGRLETACEKQIKIIKKKVYNNLKVKLQRDIQLNAIHPEPKDRETVVKEALRHAMDQYYRMCANRGISVTTYDDPEVIELIREYNDKDLTPMENGVVIQRGKI